MARALALALSVSAIAALAAPARADAPADAVPEVRATVPAGGAAVEESRFWRPYLFSLDGTTLRRGQAAVEAGVGYNGLPADKAGLPTNERRFESWVAAAAGVTDRFELFGAISMADGPDRPFGLGDARLDARVRVLDPRRRLPISIAVGAGYQVDPRLNHALTGLVAVTGIFGRFEVTANVRVIHYFADGRDPLDVFVTAGVAVRVASWLRLGAEYVGDELEGAGGDDLDVGEPGGRHYVGPSATLALWGGRVRVAATGGPVFQGERVSALGRTSLAFRF